MFDVSLQFLASVLDLSLIKALGDPAAIKAALGSALDVVAFPRVGGWR
jgi:hypothetical protein